MYPNPVKAGEPVYFEELPYGATIIIQNTLGQVLLNDSNWNNNYKLNTTNLDCGIHFVKITRQKQGYVLKLIIK
jgi:hypothetical protein